MEMGPKRRMISSRAAFLIVLLVVFWFGPGRIFQAAYRAGLYPSVNVAEVEEHYATNPHWKNQKAKATCRKGTDGWDAICDVEMEKSDGQHIRLTHAIMGGWN